MKRENTSRWSDYSPPRLGNQHKQGNCNYLPNMYEFISQCSEFDFSKIYARILIIRYWSQTKTGVFKPHDVMPIIFRYSLILPASISWEDNLTEDRWICVWHTSSIYQEEVFIAEPTSSHPYLCPPWHQPSARCIVLISTPRINSEFAFYKIKLNTWYIHYIWCKLTVSTKRQSMIYSRTLPLTLILPWPTRWCRVRFYRSIMIIAILAEFWNQPWFQLRHSPSKAGMTLAATPLLHSVIIHFSVVFTPLLGYSTLIGMKSDYHSSPNIFWQ